jgi:hypothetical protein
VPPDRDPTRIIFWLLVRLAVAEVALVIGLHTPGAIGIAVVVAATIVLVYVILLAVHVLSLRLEIRPGEVRVASLLVRRRYDLDTGPVSRLRVEPKRGVFGTQLGGFGVEIGAGHYEDELVDVVRLAPVATTLVLPTRPRRLAVVPSSTSALVRALRLAEGAASVRPVAGDQPAASRTSR